MGGDDEIGKAGGQPLATTFQEAMERVGPISSSASCYLSEPLRRLTTRVLAPVTAWGLPQCEDDAVHGPNAQRPVHSNGWRASQIDPKANLPDQSHEREVGARRLWNMETLEGRPLMPN